MAIDVEKLALLRALGASLAEKELSDVNLLLHELGLNELSYNAWYGDDRWDVSQAERSTAVLERIRDLPRGDIDSLGTAVARLYDETITVSAPSAVRPLFLFASHLSTQKDFVGAVAQDLALWGITMFVAHEAIEPDLEWQQEIEKALSHCHAGVAFLLPEFSSSRWCDQEVGWLLGRGLPCLALKFRGQDPYGPLGKKQARSIHDSMTAAQVAQAIIEWLQTKPELALQVNASLVEALKSSTSFNKTDRIWAQLHAADGMQDDQVAGLLAAIRDNDQVYNASGGTEEEFGPYKELVMRLATRQPGFEANVDLAREVAALRGLEHVLLDAGVTATPPADPWATTAPF